ncbi:class I SAM-dependent methyltransferase [uncultured Methylobacterium sp.]|uniref:class I SAM-dependent methyltransferase n=1 Tax=uncultured Methylobacterium sp. TaxID=157278 RepID=UPI0035CB9A17
MTKDQKRLVADAYDRMAADYLSKYEISTVRQKWLQSLIDGFPSSPAKVLDLGCGAGVPVARSLAELGHTVIGVDYSIEQITRARANVPEAQFIQADMSEIDFEAGRFDAVGAFYSITHIPAQEQGLLFQRVAGWLKTEGVFVASLGTGASGEWVGEWLGQPMFFGHNSEDVSLELLDRAGLLVEESAVEQQDNEDAKFLWVKAIKR